MGRGRLDLGALTDAERQFVVRRGGMRHYKPPLGENSREGNASGSRWRRQRERRFRGLLGETGVRGDAKA